MKPTAILEKLCKEAGIDQPQYKTGCVNVAGQDFFELEVVENEQGLLAAVNLFFVLSWTRLIESLTTVAVPEQDKMLSYHRETALQDAL